MLFTLVDPETRETLSLATTTKIVLIVEYEGTNYYGFQWQAGVPTIQGELENSLWQLTREKTRVIAASRTDTGVHARGQVVSFRTRSVLPVKTFVNGLNYYLPRDIAIKAAHRVDDAFNVRRAALSRQYSYYILNSPTRSPLREGFTYRVAGYLDIEAMNRACQVLIGQHDLVSFASSLGAVTRSTVRQVYKAEVEKSGKLVVFKIVANSFLPHQIRNTVGSLLRVGQGKMSIDEFCSIMEAKSPGLAGPSVPARGLCLMQVDYPHPFAGET